MATGNMSALSALATKANTGADAIQRAPIVDYDSGVRCLRTSDISNNHRFTEWGFCSVTDKIFQQFQLKANDLLIARTGPIGIPFFIETDLKAVFNNGIMRVRLDTSKCHPKYVFYALSTDHFRQNVSSVGAGSATRPNIKMEVALNYSFFLPPLPCQRHIADILSAYDDLIENNQQRIRILEEMARALYREWFVHFRFPGHESVPRVPSPLGPIPQGWEVKKLGDIVEDMRRNVPKGELGEPKPYVGLEHIPRRSLALDAWEMASNLGSNKLEFKKGEVLFGKIRPYFHKVSVAPFDGLCSADTIVIRACHPEYYAFVVACVSSDAFVAQASATANGAKMPRANWDVLERYQIVIPKGKVGDQFSALITGIIAQQQTLIFQIQNLRQTRDLLLPRLLSGRIDLSRSQEALP